MKNIQDSTCKTETVVKTIKENLNKQKIYTNGL